MSAITAGTMSARMTVASSRNLRQPEKIADPFVRHFTEAAMQAPIPIVLGGHSLVAGGLYALIEAAWARGEDLPRHVVPQPGI